MALETGSFTFDLVASNPTAADGLNQGDDHLRFIKSTIKNTFPNFTAVALSSTQAQLDAAVASVTGAAKSSYNAGTAALPGLYAAGNTNTGIYAPAANQIGLAVGGVAVVNVAASGVTITGTATATTFAGGTGQLVPTGGMLLWNEDTLPAEGGYCWANGGTLSRAANPLLWTRWGTKYGAGDGVTTFNVPNMCEVVPVGQRAMGGAASRATLATGVLGPSFVGASAASLAANQIPTITSLNAAQAINVSSGATNLLGSNAGWTGNAFNGGATYGTGYTSGSVGNVTTMSGNNSISTTYTNASLQPVSLVQPSAVVNFIIRIG